MQRNENRGIAESNERQRGSENVTVKTQLITIIHSVGSETENRDKRKGGHRQRRK